MLWQKRLLVFTAVVPKDLLHAFLTAGALAVISFVAPPEPNLPADALSSYFKQFYTSLLQEGLPLDAASSAAGRQKPVLPMCMQSVNVSRCCFFRCR